MGITNFCMLINKLHEPNQEPPSVPEHFDSILYDVQSLLHVALNTALETDEPKLFREMCHVVWCKLVHNLNEFLSHASVERLTLILSFDGEGVPMKWPTQRERRTKKEGEQRNVSLQGISKYRSVLFGTNIIALKVQHYLVERLKRYHFKNVQHLNVIVSGCNVPGEGEHKLFHMAEALHPDQCRHPLVVSEDQDVFVLSLMRLERYDTIQIYRYGKYYPVTRLVREWLPYPVIHLEICSFLFGNDFIPALVSISPNNYPTINQCLMLEDFSEPSEEESSEEEDIPITHPASILARFIQQVSKCLRYKSPSHLDASLVEGFWITFLWLRDYYTRSSFPQKYLENSIYDQFDRNMLLTALSTPRYSWSCYQRAETTYRNMIREPVSSEQAERAVFMHEDVVNLLKVYWTIPTDKACVVLKLTKRS
ncbi:XRN_N domain-containing protein [Trichonephila clavipes]|uniref:XRN_N domain-containing protein n=1 Tax=Trichonephila clavipes TaxID=2585209 RepID=A0A8X6RY81_TRICX|nr:XRN_N domain-containing protein [Trichonephila clavipes]